MDVEDIMEIKMDAVKIIKMWNIVNVKGIGIMLNTAQCVYFYSFGKTIYTETEESLQKKTFSEFKKDILSNDWNIEKLKQIWMEKHLI